MITTELFQLALGLKEPWYVVDVKFDPEQKRLDIELDFRSGSHFDCPGCNKPDCAVHDTHKRTWRHLNFFEHVAYLTARIPRTQCPDCGVKQVIVPWARPESGFSLMFEKWALVLVQHMAVAPFAHIMQLHPDRVWRILGHHVDRAVQKMDLSRLYRVGIDEVAKRKGHDYLTVFGDLKQSRVVFVADSRESEVIKEFNEYLVSKHIEPDQIQDFCLDMWPPYLKGLAEHFKTSQLVFDRFHLMAKASLAIDLVRREEAKDNEALKSTRYLWLKRKTNLTKTEKRKLTSLKRLNLKTSRAYAIVDALREIYDANSKDEALVLLKSWYFWATHSRLDPIKELAKTIRNHWQGILNFFDCYISNGIIEGLNNKIKTAMRRAYGFKTFEYLRIIIFLVAGKIPLPTQC